MPAVDPSKLARTRPASANDRLKADWSRSLLRGVVWAAVVHVVVVVGVEWEARPSFREVPELEGRGISLLPPPASDAAPGGEAPSPVPERLAEVPEETAGSAEQSPGSGDEMGEAWSAYRERLNGRGALLPSLAEPEPEESPAEAAPPGESEGDDELAIMARASTSELVALPEPDALDLDRLSELRPELALTIPNAWVLIRNPVEVETFLRRGYTLGTLDPGLDGLVSVTLWIDQRGSVEWAEVSSSSGHADLDEFALELFNEVATFRAAREDGVSVSRSVTLSVRFPWVSDR